ncbi:MAG: 30S ribosomal protein S7 [Planctomycetes bacterium]|nr:30S ribosomal protein S7 [Planctomycetota bacterium]
MAKKFTASSQQLKPDPVFNSKLVSKFVNCLMLDGKKSVAQKLFYGAMDIISKELQQKESRLKPAAEPLEVFEAAINNVKPLLEVRSKRVGGSSYQVPMQINSSRQQALSFRWILNSARGKKGKPMAQKLATEFMDAYCKTGNAMTTRENIHKMAEANKAFAHFAW